jgi:hypothetical protein
MRMCTSSSRKKDPHTHVEVGYTYVSTPYNIVTVLSTGNRITTGTGTLV